MDWKDDRHRPRHALRNGSAALAIAAGALAAFAAYRVVSQPSAEWRGDAPQRSLLNNAARGWRERHIVGRSVTISKPRSELYAFWRNFPNLASFMENVIEVEPLDELRSRWTVAAPADTELVFDSTVVEEVPDELIAWRSDDEAPIRNSGRITFRDAPGGRGTVVSATIAYDAPGGVIGRAAAKLLRKEPKVQARRDLKRFKQLMETGEISVSTPYHDH